MIDEQYAEITAFSRRHSLPPSSLTGEHGWGVPVYVDLADGSAPECQDEQGVAAIHVSPADYADLERRHRIAR